MCAYHEYGHHFEGAQEYPGNDPNATLTAAKLQRAQNHNPGVARKEKIIRHAVRDQQGRYAGLCQMIPSGKDKAQKYWLI